MSHIVPSSKDNHSIWNRILEIAKRIGEGVLLMALKLYFALIDKDTPVWARGVIVGALAYLISPLDAVPDFLPFGYVDDAGVLAGALGTVALHIKDEHVRRARAWVQNIFG